jgi:DNA ligase-1
MNDGEVRYVQGSAAKPYAVKRIDQNMYSCTCMAWLTTKAPPALRRCKHIVEILGGKPTQAAVKQATIAARRPATKAAKSLLLAHTWNRKKDVTGWLISEKLDGARALWDGTRFITRLGNTYEAPAWFRDALPSCLLDGELWVGRKQFNRTVSIVRSIGSDWRPVKFVVFDAPDQSGGFEERMAFLQNLKLPSHAEVTPQTRATSNEHVLKCLAAVEKEGAEGLMLRQPGSSYEAGRSHTLLKVKSFFDDEAKVLKHVEGEGKFKGMLGAVECVMRDGTKVKVGTGFSDDERRKPPKVGSIITFRYQERIGGKVPRFPSFVGVRTDVKGWK